MSNRNGSAHSLDAAVDAHLAQMVETLAALVAIDTTFPPGDNYTSWAAHLESLLAPLGFDCKRVEVPETLWASPGSTGPRVNLIAARPGHELSPLNIYFHSDTVPAGPGWSSPPFALTRDGDRLLGRGTADMKGTIAAVLGAINALDSLALAYRFSPVLLFCTDEEGGLYPGVRYLAETGAFHGPLMCLNGQAAPRIWAGCFGSVDLRLSLLGEAAHSGDPGGGVNAVQEGLPVLNALHELSLARSVAHYLHRDFAQPEADPFRTQGNQHV